MKFEPWTTAYELLDKKLQKLYPKFQELHVSMKKGGILIAYKAYVAFMVLISLIALAITIPVTFVIFPLATGIAILSIQNLAVSLVAGVSVGLLAMIALYIYPGMKASNRKGPIDINLPYIANFLTLLSSSNVPPSVIFRSMSKIDTLKAVRLEFGNIVRDVEVFGNDLLTAIQENAKLTPNKDLREVLLGYVATIKTGGNPTDYLKITSQQITKERISKLDMMLESLSAIAEIYIMVLVATPLLFTVLFATLGMIGGGNMGGIDLGVMLYLLTYLGIPIMGAVIMVMLSMFEK